MCNRSFSFYYNECNVYTVSEFQNTLLKYLKACLESSISTICLLARTYLILCYLLLFLWMEKFKLSTIFYFSKLTWQLQKYKLFHMQEYIIPKGPPFFKLKGRLMILLGCKLHFQCWYERSAVKDVLYI